MRRKSLCRMGLHGTYPNLLLLKYLSRNPPYWVCKFKINNCNRRKSLLSKELQHFGRGRDALSAYVVRVYINRKTPRDYIAKGA